MIDLMLWMSQIFEFAHMQFDPKVIDQLLYLCLGLFSCKCGISSQSLMVETFDVHSKTVNPVVDSTSCIWVLYSFSNYKLATGWEYGWIIL